jgi:hypothetical protein
MEETLAWAMWPLLGLERWQWSEEDVMWAGLSWLFPGVDRQPQNQALPETFPMKNRWFGMGF